MFHSGVAFDDLQNDLVMGNVVKATQKSRSHLSTMPQRLK